MCSQHHLLCNEDAPELRAYLAAKARFDRIDAERDRRLAPIYDGEPDAPEDDLETRLRINEALGYWEAFDALCAAERALHAQTLAQSASFGQ